MQMNAGSEATNTNTKTSNQNLGGDSLLDSESPTTEFEDERVQDAPQPLPMSQVQDSVPDSESESEAPAYLITKSVAEKAKSEQRAKMVELKSRAMPAAGNPNAKIADPVAAQVIPRYDIVQNRSDKVLVIPDIKTEEDDPGEMLQPGAVIKLTDFYSPQQINRSKGLRHAATEMEGVDGNPALVPLATEEQGAEFTPPKRETPVPGTTVIDTQPNDFDIRFEELEARDRKREERLKRKSLGMRKTAVHGKVSKV